MMFIYNLFKKAYWFTKSGENEIKVLGIILLVSFTGYALNFMQLDTFRIYGFWLCAAIVLILMNKSNFKKNEE